MNRYLAESLNKLKRGDISGSSKDWSIHSQGVIAAQIATLTAVLRLGQSMMRNKSVEGDMCNL